MRFRKGAQLDTSQVTDLRGQGGGRSLPRGRMAVGGGGLIGIIVTLILVFVGGGGGLGGLAPLEGEVVGSPQGGGGGEVAAECRTAEDAEQREDCRVLAVINSIQSYWNGAFESSGQGYETVDTVFFDGEVNTACGAASSAVGPFYCPADRLVYIDLGFFGTLEEQFGAQGGPFAQAYVLAHEYGHHVQNLLGVLEQTAGDRQGPESLAVRSELQADCYAGVWAANAVSEGTLIVELTQQDIAQGLDAAAAVGDDRIQEMAQGQVNPETWTHGSSEQRQRWFTRGYESGDPAVCDTFSGAI
jgi:predicted metalloprotease